MAGGGSAALGEGFSVSVPAPSRPAALAARLLVVLALVVVSAPLLGASPASAVVDGGFEIDGDLTASTNLDWSNVPGQPAMRDVVSAASDDGFKSGQTSKEEDPNNWDLVTEAVTPNANDIGDIYGYGRLLDGHQWAFVGFERAATGGSTSFNIEFNARRNRTNVHGVSVPDRQVDDILIDIQQQGSGAIVVGGVYQWNGGAWVYSPAAAAVVSSAYNTGTVTDVDGNSLPAGRFAEISIDITRALGQASACPGLAITTLNIRSRSSASSITSTLKDYVQPADLGVPTGCGGLTIAKKDGTGAALPGAAFSVSPNPVAATPGTLTVTDGGANDPDGAANGSIAFGSVKPGGYTITETAPPAGYLYSTDPVSATVTAGATTVVPVVNRLGSASWTKLDATSKEMVGGATFTVTGTGGAAESLVSSPITVVDNGARDTDPAAGAITVTGLPTGTYAVRETVPPTGYDLPTSGNPQTFSVTQAAPNPTVGAFSDPRRNGSVTVTKTDAVSGAALDATFRLWRDNGDDAFSAADTSVAGPTPSTGGTLTFGNLPWGTYWVEETVPPTGYLVDPTLPRRVVVNASSLTPTVAVADPRRPSTLTVSKVDDADGRPLADARMKLWRDSDGVAGPSAGDTAVDTCDTTAAGTCSVGQVGFGTFYWQEVTPPPDYLLPATPYSASVTITAANAGTVLPVREFRDIEIALAAHLTKSGTLADRDGDQLADVGEVVTYTFTLRNDGNAPLTGLEVIDPKVGAVTCPAPAVPVGGSAQCTATYTVTQADVDDGSVDNAATATATGPNGDTAGSNEATHSLPVDDSSSVRLEKTAELQDADGDGYADEGETVRFVFTVTNTGNDSLHGATVDDPTLGAVSCPAGTFAPKAHVTCTKDYVVTATDVDNGSVTNVATASALDTDGTTVTSSPDDTVTPTDTPTAIRLVKTGTLADSTLMGGDDDGKADVGEVVTWSFQVVNDGKATLHDVRIDDPSLGPVTCLVTTVAPGASVTGVKSSVVTQADVDRGEVVNVATASGTPIGRPTVTSEEAGDRVATDTRAAVSVVKAGDLQDQDGDELADLGEVVDYTFTVTNDGTTTLHGITVDDPKVTSVDCPAGDLLPGRSVACTASYVVTQADVDHGSVDNTATASALDPSDTPLISDESSDSIGADNRDAVALVKSATLVDGDGDDLADAGETVDYRFEVSNDGNVTLHDVVVDDPKVASVDCPAGDLLPGDSVTCTASYVVTQADVDHGSVDNVATASAATPHAGRVGSALAEARVPADTRAALGFDKRAKLLDSVDNGGDGDGLADAGERIDFTFVVTNDGAVTVSGVTVDDPMLAGLPVPVVVSCPSVALAPGESLECSAAYTVRQADVDRGEVANVASASGVPAASSPGVDSQPETTHTSTDSRDAVSVKKSATLADVDGDHLADEGERVDYAFEVHNDGTTTLHGITVDDPRVASVDCPVGDLLPGDSVTCTASYVVTQADVDGGVVRNVATASATGPTDVPVTSAPSDAEVAVDGAGALTLLKTGVVEDSLAVGGDGDGLADEGETIAYSFAVRNAGNVTLADVAVDDPRIAAVDCPTGDLAPGASVTCSGTYVATQADVDAGEVVNTAVATARRAGNGAQGGELTSNESTETLPADATAGLAIAKSATLRDKDGDDRADQGERIDYTFEVTNTGTVTMTAVSVVDPMLGAGAVACPATTLAPGASMTCAASHRVTDADLDDDEITNVAWAVGTPVGAGECGPDGCESEPDSATVASEQTTVVTEPGDTPRGPDKGGKHGTSSATAGGSTPEDGVLPNTGGPAAGLAGLGLLAVLAGLVALVRGRRRDEETA